MRDLLVLTNAVTDVVRTGTDEEVRKRGLRKGHAHSNENGHFRPEDRVGARLVHGGAPGNVAAGAAHLGLACGVIGAVGRDEVGEAYIRDVEARGLENWIRRVDGPSGICWILVTPDGERTMAVDLGVSPRFEIPREAMPRYRAFLTSGYELISNPRKTWEAIEAARAAGVLFAFDVADAHMVAILPGDVRRAAEAADVLFANEHEARALTGCEPEEALKRLSRPDRTVAVKVGARGALVASAGRVTHAPSLAERVVDTTGAGDAFAAGFLAARLAGAGPEECARRGSEFAARVCAVEGARLPA